MTQNKFTNWLKLSISLFCIILILIGFALGYIYNNYKSGACIERPLSYGIKQINDINNDSFTCACSPKSYNINPFYFNESGIYYGTFLESQIIIIPE